MTEELWVTLRSLGRLKSSMPREPVIRQRLANAVFTARLAHVRWSEIARITMLDVRTVKRLASTEGTDMHSDYPHLPGTLYDCMACEQQCHCDDGSCVYHAPDNPYRTESDRNYWEDES